MKSKPKHTTIIRVTVYSYSLFVCRVGHKFSVDSKFTEKFTVSLIQVILRNSFSPSMTNMTQQRVLLQKIEIYYMVILKGNVLLDSKVLGFVLKNYLLFREKAIEKKKRNNPKSRDIKCN